MRATLIRAFFLMFVGVGVGSQAANLTPGRHRVSVDGLQFSYYVAGRGPLLVIQCPGWGIGSEYLRNGFEPLEQHFTLLFYDTRGSGDSGRPRDASTITITQFSKDLERLRQFWGLKRMRLLGHSWGGGIALDYAMRYPTHLQSLILVDSAIPGFDYSAIRAVTHAQWLAAQDDKNLADSMKALEADPPVSTDEEFSAKLHRELPFYFVDPITGPEKFWQTYAGQPSAWTWNAWQANFDTEKHRLASARIEAIRVPTLIIYGREDRICPAVMGYRLHAQIDTSQLRVLSNAGHLPWIEAPDPFFSTTERFLAGRALHPDSSISP